MRTSWEENLRTAAAAVRTHKLRSTLTVLGVAIGVLSVISVAAIIHGLNLYVDSKVQELGSNTLLVSRFPAFVRVEDWTEDIRQRKHLTAADARAIAEQCRACVIATPMLTRFPLFGQTSEVRFRNRRVDVPLVRGAEPAMTRAFPLFVVNKGRMFTEAEDAHSARVCVIGLAIADSLFGPLDPLGRTLRLNGLEFEVIGVWEKHEGLFGGPGLDDVIVIPYRTFNKLWPEIEEQIRLTAQADPTAPTEDEIRDALRYVVDPEVGLNVVDLGLVYGIEVSAERIGVRMTMTTPACPLSDTIMESARAAVRAAAPQVPDIEIELVWDPPWTPDMMSEIARGHFGWPGS